ncbi:MAG: methyltransferase domain-containing protein [Candidatus Verstraetearchaeota archaeon]|nr:methyltransferase domain-containing protein [Candidatus Verstraetearchaeota archaeon]
MVRQSNPERLLLLLSGEHPTIPYSEVCAVLQTEGVEFHQVSRHDQVLIIDTEGGAGEAVKGRAAYVMEGGRFILRSEPSELVFERCCGGADWSFLEGRSFGVKVTRVKEYWREMGTQELQGIVGEIVKGETDSRVDLEGAEVWIRGVVTDGGVFLYTLDFQTDRRAFAARRPKTRPYFHPGVLDPKLSRAFVNLSRVKRGEVFLDPFCGTGGFLIEGALVGCRVCGMDLDMRMVPGARRNLRHYGLEADLIHGDARNLPLRTADGMATDPPYGRGTSTRGENVRTILSGFFREAHRVLREGGCLCTAAPIELNPSELVKRAGFKVHEEHSMRVHKSLTRSIVVAERQSR